MNIKTLLGRAAKVVVGSLLLFTSVSHAQTALYISDGNGHITTLTGLGTSGGTFTFPSGGGSVLTNVGSGTLSLGGDFSTSGTYPITLTGSSPSSSLTLPTGPGMLMLNPMTTAGDIIYGGAAGAATRLAGSGTNGYVLTYNTTSGAPEWDAAASSLSGLTPNGAVYAATSSTVASTAASTVAGQFLQTTTAGAVPTWATSLGVANGGTGLTTINTGDILYGSASNTLLNLTIGSSNQVLTVVSGDSPDGTNVPSGFSNPMTTKGDMIYEDATHSSLLRTCGFQHYRGCADGWRQRLARVGCSFNGGRVWLRVYLQRTLR